MKKYLPYILVGVGFLILAIVLVVIKAKNKKVSEVPEKQASALIELSPEKRPVVSLIPSEDGHYLKLKIEKLNFGADSLDYELVYQTKDIQQGVPGSFKIEGNDNFEADLLLGSESSGKFRYDEGVETGTLDLRFRNEDGELMVNFTTEFHLQTGTKELVSVDGKFKYTLDKVEKGVYYVTMQTFGEVDASKAIASKDGYAVFASENK